MKNTSLGCKYKQFMFLNNLKDTNKKLLLSNILKSFYLSCPSSKIDWIRDTDVLININEIKVLHFKLLRRLGDRSLTFVISKL